MRFLIVIFIILNCFFVSYAADVRERVKISGSQGVIVSCEEMMKYRDYCWSPTIDQLTEMEKGLFPFVKKTVQSYGGKLRYPLFKYNRQYRGEKWRGMNIIVIKGYYRLANNDGWRTGMGMVIGGGHWFFTATYNPSKREFIEFLFNSPL